MNENQLLSLAGIYQSASVVEHLANQGWADESAFNALIYSLFQFEAANTPDVYGGVSEIRLGLRTLQQHYAGSGGNKQMAVVRYVIALLALGTKLFNDSRKMRELGEELQNLSSGWQDNLSETTTSLADIYRKHISVMQPRIMVNGNPKHLQDNEIQSKIRTALLAGIRSGVLWKQLKGSKLQLLFQRKQIQVMTTGLLQI